MNPISVGYSSHIKDGSVVTVDSSLAAGYDSSTVIGNFVTVGQIRPPLFSKLFMSAICGSQLRGVR